MFTVASGTMHRKREYAVPEIVCTIDFPAIPGQTHYPGMDAMRIFSNLLHLALYLQIDSVLAIFAHSLFPLCCLLHTLKPKAKTFPSSLSSFLYPLSKNPSYEKNECQAVISSFETSSRRTNWKLLGYSLSFSVNMRYCHCKIASTFCFIRHRCSLS